MNKWKREIEASVPGTRARVVGSIGELEELCDQIVASLADILGVDEFAPKSALLLHCPINTLVRLYVDLVLAVQADE